MSLHDLLVLFLIALPPWAACGATMVIGMAKTTLNLTLALHAVVAVVGFGAASYLYFHWTASAVTPLQAATVLTAVVVILDVFVVAMLFQRSFEMFRSFAGTWLPFALIFAAS
ncbi:MAG: hypothetical protein QF902_08650 [Rhodospirillales bacterium]|nr:hypothetical protein [Rhodospirillales bacterium]